MGRAQAAQTLVSMPVARCVMRGPPLRLHASKPFLALLVCLGQDCGWHHVRGIVHDVLRALMQVVSFCAERRELGLVWKSMNSLLPADIRVVNLQEALSTFNARHRLVST